MKKITVLCAALATALFATPLAILPVFADEVDDLFSDTTALDVAETATVDNPVSAIAPVNKFQWAGDFSGTGGSQIRYGDQVGKIGDLSDYDENLLLSLKARLWFDARPEDHFRVFGKFVTEYPFEKDAAVPASTTAQSSSAETTTEVPNVKVFELFSDFDWKEKIYFRFGKQNTGWGVSRFYQIGDPLSVGVKDPTDPAADLEGPVALKATVPFGLNSIVFVSAVKNSYLPANENDASIRDVGYGAKADIYVKVPDNKVIGNGQFTLGAYGQRRLAPKVVASYSTSIQKFQVFTDQVVSFGLDSYRLSSDEVALGPGLATVRDTEKPWRKPFYSATLGTMYTDSVNHFTLYAEYLFNGAGSMKKSEYKDLVARFEAEQMAKAVNPLSPAVPATLSASDLGGYYGMHNSAVSLSFTDLFHNADLGFSATWLQNWIDLSGMVKPALTWEPVKHVVLEGGATLAYGDNDTEWVLKTSTSAGESARTAGYIAVKLTNVRF
jgi:hypothetical protein